MIHLLIAIPLLAAGSTADSTLQIVGARFELPAGCKAACRFVADGYEGSVSCPGQVKPVHYGAGILPRNEEPVSIWLSADGSDRLGDAVLQWGTSKRDARRYCATVAYPVIPGSLRFRHSFCVPSEAPEMQRIAVSILRSFRRAVSFTGDTCGVGVRKVDDAAAQR